MRDTRKHRGRGCDACISQKADLAAVITTLHQDLAAQRFLAREYRDRARDMERERDEALALLAAIDEGERYR